LRRVSRGRWRHRGRHGQHRTTFRAGNRLADMLIPHGQQLTTATGYGQGHTTCLLVSSGNGAFVSTESARVGLGLTSFSDLARRVTTAGIPTYSGVGFYAFQISESVPETFVFLNLEPFPTRQTGVRGPWGTRPGSTGRPPTGPGRGAPPARGVR